MDSVQCRLWVIPCGLQFVHNAMWYLYPVFYILSTYNVESVPDIYFYLSSVKLAWSLWTVYSVGYESYPGVCSLCTMQCGICILCSIFWVHTMWSLYPIYILCTMQCGICTLSSLYILYLISFINHLTPTFRFNPRLP